MDSNEGLDKAGRLRWEKRVGWLIVFSYRIH